MSPVVVFARPPLPGKGKSRLAEEIGQAKAARVASILLDHALATAAATGLRTVLALADGSGTWRPPADVELERQQGTGLGERMAAAFARRFAEGHRRVVLIGADCPALSPGRLERAFAKLASAEVVLGPAVDGGYWLVGQCAPGVDLFSEVAFSSPHTFAATAVRLKETGARWCTLETLRDVDTRADLEAAVADPEISADLRRRLAEQLGSGAG